MAAVQAKLREAQEAALAAEQADEHYADVDRAATAKLAPTFRALERERLMDEGTGAVLQLSWYLDHVTAAASERRQLFVRETKERAALIRAKVEAAKANRPLVMCVGAVASAARARARSRPPPFAQPRLLHDPPSPHPPTPTQAPSHH